MFSNKQEIEGFIIEWNSLFPFDRYYREKYKVPFNSKEHRETCQIDIFFDIYEDKFIADYFVNLEKEKKQKEEYERGILFKKDYVSKDEIKALDLFDKLKF